MAEIVCKTGEPVTWQQYLDNAVNGSELVEDVSEGGYVIYPDAEYSDVIASHLADSINMVFAGFGGSLDDIEEALPALIASLPDWDTLCGVEWNPSDDETGNGDDQPGGGEQTPDRINIDVPEGAEVGKPVTLSATVLDADGNPVEGQEVTFTICEGDGSGERSGTLLAAVRHYDTVKSGQTVLTATTDANGIAKVQYTPKKSGNLQVSASTGGSNPISSTDETVPIVEETGNGNDGDGDGDGDNSGGNNNAGGNTGSGSGSGSGDGLFGSLGSLFGSLGS